MQVFPNTTARPGTGHLAWLLSGLLLLSGCGAVPEPAQIKDPQGKVQVRSGPAASFAPAREKDPVSVGGAVRTGEDGRTLVAFEDGSELTVKPDSYFELGQGTALGQQNEGTVLYKIKKQKAGLTVETPHGITAVLGTTFLLRVGSDSTMLGVEEGKVSFTPKGGKPAVTLEAKQKISADPSGKVEGPSPFNLTEEEFNYIKIDGKWVKPK